MIKGLEPGNRAALLISECQNGITNKRYNDSSLVGQVAERDTIRKVAALAAQFRARQLPVVHCHVTLPRNPDGWYVNCLLAKRLVGRLAAGSVEAASHDDLPVMAEDYVSERHHGMSPFTNTGLDAILRSHQIDTVVLSGVSTNVALFGASIEAVGLGYKVVLAEDCSAGGTAETHQIQISMHLPLLASISCAEEIVAALDVPVTRETATA